MPIKYFDMFSGIGGFRSALEVIGGFECVGYLEIDKYARKAYETMYNRKVNCFLKIQEKSYPISCLISTLFAEDSLASPFLSQGQDGDLTIFAEHCFSRLQGLLPLKDLSFYSLRMSSEFLMQEVVKGNLKNRIGYKKPH